MAAGGNGADVMMDMMKKNLLMILSQTAIMSWIQYFYSGFILTRLPFELTIRFKQIMQRGIECNDMDVKYVSSISLYFLLLFGLHSIFSLLSPLTPHDHSFSPVPMSGMQQSKQVENMFKSELEFLELKSKDYQWGLIDVETRVLEKYGRIGKYKIQ